MRSPPSVATGLFAGRYAIEREIGQGASAIVYLASDTQAGTAVALKILRPELVESRASDRFVREIKRMSGLRHPNILPVLDAGEHEGQLYFALPYMEGGTLRQLLKREKHLELSSVIEISRSVAEALDYAHERGLIHRDVKPENILFTSGRAVLGDFGIARAIDLSGSGGTGTTSRNVVRGTPAYMSPEQAAASQEIDGRSDVFSLACVIYEMITGMQAYMGPTDEAVIAQRFLHPPRDVRVYRPVAPAAIETVFSKAFALSAADRYRTAGGFADALATVIQEQGQERSGNIRGTIRGYLRRRTLVYGSLSLAIALLAFAHDDLSLALGIGDSPMPAAPVMDTLRVAVFPSSDDSIATQNAAELVREALQLRGYGAVDAFHTGDALTRVAERPAGERHRAAAELVGAGRYMRVSDVAAGDDSTGLLIALFDVRYNQAIASQRVAIPRSWARADFLIASTLDQLIQFPPLFRSSDASTRTTSWTARRAYLRGHAALGHWNLDAADSEFAAASDTDPGYAQASLWLAVIRHWRRQPVARWEYAARRAASNASRLSERDSLMSAALVALAAGDRDRACSTWRLLSHRDTHDFAAWYGLGRCIVTDSLVVRDRNSPSGWRFRSSYAEALRAFERAFQLLPSIHQSFAGNSFADVRTLFMTRSDALRVGWAKEPDTTRFLAYPSWESDSLEFVPRPARDIHGIIPGSRSSANVNRAVNQQRRRFLQLATMWRAALPQSPAAIESVAMALELLGDASALDTLRLARAAASSSDDRIRMGIAEMWMRLTRGAVGNILEVQRARALADTLLAIPRSAHPRVASLLASAAAVTGRATLAADLYRIAERDLSLPSVGDAANALVLFAALGGPVDSLRELSTHVRGAMDRALTPAEASRVRSSWLMRAASLAVPNHDFTFLDYTVASGYRARLLRAWRGKDLASAREVLEGIRAERRLGGMSAVDIATDGLYVEAAILAALGDTANAREWLRPTLDSLSLVPSYALGSPIRAAALMRCMVLRAELEARNGDVERARTWAAPVALMWSDADAFLQPTVRTMRRLASAK